MIQESKLYLNFFLYNFISIFLIQAKSGRKKTRLKDRAQGDPDQSGPVGHWAELEALQALK